ncbi:HEPN domain-containing protein [Halarsenatibacter silvermanii]|uniref:HEPN domain-containing protein n=1 Tax=Halarsenatibacter silvermanii TaxID=321763 RepID=A0A1G9TZB7_9FIRM|nr:HEPN domain-containing protein [Halarsenatibacter silvermanii]SDM53130.1 HEPN domain-containing protein [Halarsenatibacter silvermanii]
MSKTEDEISYWIEASDYDLETAKSMLDTKRYLYVGFMCHQAVEKILKGLYVSKYEKTPPYTHNLTRLAKETDIYSRLDEKKQYFLDVLEPLNIEARYPSDRDKLLESLNRNRCDDLLSRTEGLIKWIKKKL